MDYLIAELPRQERPRERMVMYGAQSLADYELIALIIGSGMSGNGVLAIARTLTIKYKTLAHLAQATASELCEVRGIGAAKAGQILAALELGRRMQEVRPWESVLTSPLASYEYLKPKFAQLEQEQLYGLYLSAKGEVIKEAVIALGGLNQTVFNPRDVLKWAFKAPCYGIIIAHNHPSGDPMPSPADDTMTAQLAKACALVGVKLIDHLVIGKGTYYSYLERGKLS